MKQLINVDSLSVLLNWDHRSVVRTPACHAGGAGSIPAGPANMGSWRNW